jgi:uncharacterized protein YegP (UPF0339 family)
MPAKFQLKKAKNDKCYFNLCATNGEVILTSQMYGSKATAKKGIASVQANGGQADRFERRQDKRGKHYFVLKAGNHQVIGTSESYSGKPAAEKGVKSVMKNAAKAAVEDLTG